MPKVIVAEKECKRCQVKMYNVGATRKYCLICKDIVRAENSEVTRRARLVKEGNSTSIPEKFLVRGSISIRNNISSIDNNSS